MVNLTFFVLFLGAKKGDTVIAFLLDRRAACLAVSILNDRPLNLYYFYTSHTWFYSYLREIPYFSHSATFLVYLTLT